VIDDLKSCCIKSYKCVALKILLRRIGIGKECEKGFTFHLFMWLKDNNVFRVA